MKLARAVGMDVPDAALVSFGDSLAYVVKRYDRVEAEGGIKRLHQEDFCQALGVSRVHKYEENRGPGFAACGQLLLRPEVVDAAGARDDIIRCALFNYLIGNCDAHAKNFSLTYDKDAGIRLAPFYDLVSTRAYPNLSSRFAMSIGKTWEYDEVGKDSWKRFAKSLTVRDKLVFRLMEELDDEVSGKLDEVYGQFTEEYGHSKVCADIKKAVEIGLGNFRRVLPV
jgi:serine/threonine-protein kinase HipA